MHKDTLRNKLDTVVVRESRETLSIQLEQLLVYKLSEAETITAASACLQGPSLVKRLPLSARLFVLT